MALCQGANNLAEIEEISKPLTKMKNKKVLLFAGLGLAAGVIVLAVKGAGWGSAGAPVVAGVVGGDQAVSALGAQMQAFQQAVTEGQTSLTERLDVSDQTLGLLGQTVESNREGSAGAFAAVLESQKNIVGQLLELQQSQEIKETAAPVRAPDKIVYGATVDIANARSILGNTGYSYIDTTNIKSSNLRFDANSLIVGGAGAVGGVGDVNLSGARRLFGEDREATAAEIANYKANL